MEHRNPKVILQKPLIFYDKLKIKKTSYKSRTPKHNKVKTISPYPSIYEKAKYSNKPTTLLSRYQPLKFLQSNKESNREACEQHPEQKKKYLLKEDIKFGIKFQSLTRPPWKTLWKFKKNLEIGLKHKNLWLIPILLNTLKEFEFPKRN